MNDKPDVLVIGAGIVGACCALELARRGRSVTVVDRGEIGGACSYGNAGWITPCFALPLPLPGMFWKSLHWLRDPASPLYIQPRFSPALIRWLTRFVFSMNTRLMQRSVAALTALARHSLEAFRQLDAENPGAFGFKQNGLLMVAETEAGRRDASQALALVAPHGIVGRAVSRREISGLEPAVKAAGFVGGVFFPEEAHAQPFATVQTVAERAARLGAVMLPKTEVFDFACRGGRVESVRTTRGLFQPRQIVLAAGSWSALLARSMRLRLPLLAGKGYSVVVERFAPAPSIPIMFLETKVAVTPHKDSIRFAGTLELVDLDESITARRVDAILRAARKILTVPEQVRVIEVWRGLRPCTPDGMPIIGRPREFENLVIATGHQMLGLLTAPGTGRLAADILTANHRRLIRTHSAPRNFEVRHKAMNKNGAVARISFAGACLRENGGRVLRRRLPAPAPPQACPKSQFPSFWKTNAEVSSWPLLKNIFPPLAS